MSGSVAYVIPVCLSFIMIVGVASAATHIVGDTTGWSIPASTSFYSTWAAKQTFKTGDILVFNYMMGHTVAEVSKSDYDSCNTKNPITIKTTGPVNVTVTSGTHYYICTITGHCDAGQKLVVSTSGSSTTSPSSSPSSSPTSSPTTSPSTSPSSSPTTTTTPAPSSSDTTTPKAPSSDTPNPTPSSAPVVVATPAVAGFVMVLVGVVMLG